MKAFSMPPRPARISLFLVPEQGNVTGVRPTMAMVPAGAASQTTSLSLPPIPLDRISLTPPEHRQPSLCPLPRRSVIPRTLSIAPIATPTGANPYVVAAPKRRLVVVLNQLIVGAYKVAGLTVLLLILGGLTSYLGVRAFFFANTSWVVPNVMSPNDERVLRVTSQVAEESARRDELVTQRLDLQTDLGNATRVAAAESAFQKSFKVARESDLAKRSEALSRYQGLLGHYQQTKSEIQSASQAFAGMSKDRIASDFDARLIDKDAMVNQSFQLAQIAGANLSLSEHSVDIADRIAGLRHEVGSLRNASAHGQPEAGELSYEVVRMQHELDVSVLASQKADDDVTRLKAKLGLLDTSIGDYDHLISRLSESPYAMAADGRASLAFVPYENRARVVEGAPIYACKVTLLGCKVVGHVGALVDGEVTDHHPLSGRPLRGVMVRMVLDDARAVEKAVLHIGRAPLFF